MNVWVVVPTYNERENLPPLLQELFSLAIFTLHVLVVDDASPDGTGALADALRSRYANLSVLHRNKKEGLGPAYLAGFSFALERGAEFLIEMDADGSHAPSTIPAMLDAARTADLVLGSRYCEGGSIRNWDWFRRSISRAGNWYARIILGMPVHDLTGGFKCFRRSALADLSFSAVSSIGYHFQIEVTYRLWHAKKTVREIPITFTERHIGRSKFHPGIIWESMIAVWRLRFSS